MRQDRAQEIYPTYNPNPSEAGTRCKSCQTGLRAQRLVDAMGENVRRTARGYDDITAAFRDVCCDQLSARNVRSGTDGGIALKPSDRWTISLCRDHHAEQHQIGEVAFEGRHGIDMYALAEAFARRSPHMHRSGDG